MAEREYVLLREVVSPQIANLDSRQLRQVLAANNVDADALEDWLSDIGHAIAPALPAIGAAVGSIIAPGAGTAVGGLLGNVAGGLLAGGPAPPPPPPPPPLAAFPAPPPPPSFLPPPHLPPYGYYPSPYPAPAQAPDSQQAAMQLMQMMMKQQTMQALIAMMLGRAGRSTIPVGGSPVPVSAFPNMLGSLANQAVGGFRPPSYGPVPAQYFAPQYGGDFASSGGQGFGAPGFDGGDGMGSFGPAPSMLMDMLQESEPRRWSASSTRRSPARKQARVVETLEAVGL